MIIMYTVCSALFRTCTMSTHFIILVIVMLVIFMCVGTLTAPGLDICI